MTGQLELTGLDGRNPLGFMAAVGALVVADRMADREIRLSWSDHAIPRPTLHGVDSFELLGEWVVDDLQLWCHSPALEFEGANDVKFAPEQIRRYLQTCRNAPDGGRSVGLASALVAERSLDNKGVAKPTDLHFTAGQQMWLRMARELRDGLGADDVLEAVAGPWRYESRLPTLGWDVTDDRVYALSAENPAKDKKLSVPGADWLGVQALCLLPVVRGADRTVTPGCGGSWKRGTFAWPLWPLPLGTHVVRTLLVGGRTVGDVLGVRRQLASVIRRSEQGGYGSFGPPQVLDS